MMFSLVCIAEIQPFSRVLKLTYFTSLASIDFYSDLLYIFTQTFANPFLFIAAIFIAFAPTIVYMTATGLFWSFFSKMIPGSIKAAMGVWVIVFFGEEDEEPWLWVVLVECSRVLRQAVQQLKEDFAQYGDNFLNVILMFLKFLFLSAYGLVVLALGLVGCAAMLTISPIAAAAILVSVPSIGILWCVVHVNFKLSIFPGATARFYEFMLHEPPDPASTRSMNLSFFTEIVCESLPQFVILLANEALLSSGRARGTFEGTVVVFTLVSSALDLLSNFWPYLIWSCRHGSISKALDEVLYVVTDEHAKIVQERTAKRKVEVQKKAQNIPKSKVLPTFVQSSVGGSRSRVSAVEITAS